jgi:hypothetical protein
MFQTQGLMFRKTAVTSTGTVQHMSTCMIHPATSEYDYAEITIKGSKDICMFYVFIGVFKISYTGRFIMFSVITNIYNKKTKGPTLMEFFTVTGKLKSFFFDN